MKAKYIIGLALLALLVSCRTVKTSSTTSSVTSVSKAQDSISSKETATIDTLKVPYDSTGIFLPINWIEVPADTSPKSVTIKVPELNTVTKTSGRANLTITRTAAGLQVSATCDSVYALYINRTKEVFQLRSRVDSLSRASDIKSDSKTVVYRIPVWAILALSISVVINALFVFYKIKQRLL